MNPNQPGEGRKPWEQLADEPAEAYARFLQFLSLGPGRSIDAAYRLFTPVATNSGKSRRGATAKKARVKSDNRRASGTWTSDSTTYRWSERATAKDIEDLLTVNREVVVVYLNTLKATVLKLLAAAQDVKVRPRTWPAMLEGLMVIGSFIPPETAEAVAKLQNDAAAGRNRAVDGAGIGSGPVGTTTAGS